ncbi:MAG: primosomal protein N' [Lachnospiraceae bacterium]
MSLYAHIIIDVTTSQLDRPFQYKIPQELQQQIQIGSCVKVPFGNGNRVLTGYVIDMGDEPDWAVEKIKTIISLVSGALPVEAQMIQLAAWIRNQYGGSMIQALKTVMPVKEEVRQVETKKYCLAVSEERAREQLELAEKRHYAAKARLLQVLLQQGEVSSTEARQKLGVMTSTVQSLEKAGIIRVMSAVEYRGTVREQNSGRKVELNESQQKAVEQIWEDYLRGERKPWLIHGVTGSGKTEVYMELIERVCRMQRQVIVLIPEISLTKQTIMRFYGRFGNRISMVNSRLSSGEKYDQFMRARRGEIDIMIGPRSALFTPFPNLGLIIIDEEHEQTYRSDLMPRYHARETAVERARLSDAMVVLGSATPSLESYYRTVSKEYGLVKLNYRAIEGSGLPSVCIVDLREEMKQGNRSIFSRELHQKIEDRLAKKEQVMLFLNRRGFAGFISCRSCGEAIKCPHCDVSMTLHNNGSMVCHYCGYHSWVPKKCPYCDSPYIAAFGLGTQKVEAMARQQFPTARILRMDMDTTMGKDGHEKILNEFRENKADILIGTQMIVKGHDFPNVTLMGILAADLSLHSADYRCGERTFQLLTQAAGRAGRGDKAGDVVIQTYMPEHYSIQCAARQNYEEFFHQEMQYRRMLQYPPAGCMMELMVSSANYQEAEEEIQKAASLLRKWEEKVDYTVIGPADASVAKIKDIYRKILYVKSSRMELLVQVRLYLEKIFDKENRKNLYIQFDFNV